MPFRILSIVLLLAWQPLARAADWSVNSDAEQASLVELFTSQGCSSCPPADRWLSALKAQPTLWKQLVPVAFHVTYWNYLGWRDPFARPAHDERQRRQAAGLRAGVYTPGMFLNKEEFRSWRFPGSAGRLGPGDAVGVLSAASRGESIEVRFTPAEARRMSRPVVELTYLRTGLSTPVKAGENRGRQLQHDFVAGEVYTSKLKREGADWVAQISAPQPKDGEAVALWLTDKNGRYLQAAGGWL